MHSHSFDLRLAITSHEAMLAVALSVGLLGLTLVGVADVIERYTVSAAQQVQLLGSSIFPRQDPAPAYLQPDPGKVAPVNVRVLDQSRGT